jgi:hypothetical protein
MCQRLGLAVTNMDSEKGLRALARTQGQKPEPLGAMAGTLAKWLGVTAGAYEKEPGLGGEGWS